MVGKTKTAKRSQRKKKGSKYIGVYQTNAVKPTWEAKIKHGGKLVYGGGAFPTQEQAAKRVNSMCRKFNISEKNPGLLNEEESDILKLFLKKLERYVPKVGDKIQAIQEFFTQTKPKRDVRVNKIMVVQKIDEDGDILVSNTDWSKRSWISKKDFGKIKIADECTNPTVGEKDKVKRNRRKKIPSEYIGVHQNNTLKPTWSARIKHNNDFFYGGAFPTQEQTAKRVNTMCRKFNIKAKNPGLLDEDEADIPKRFKLEHTSVTKTIQKRKRTRKKKLKPFVPCPNYVFVIYKNIKWCVSRTHMMKSRTRMLTPVFSSEEEAQKDIENRTKKIKRNSYDDEIPPNSHIYRQHTDFEIKPLRLRNVQPDVPCPSNVFVIDRTQNWNAPRRRGCCVLIPQSKTIMLKAAFKSEKEAQEDIDKREKKINMMPNTKTDWYGDTTYDHCTYFKIKKLRLKK